MAMRSNISSSGMDWVLKRRSNGEIFNMFFQNREDAVHYKHTSWKMFVGVLLIKNAL